MALGSAIFLGACGGGGESVDNATGPKNFQICHNPAIADPAARAAAAQAAALAALFDAREGDTISFCAGTFEFTTGLIAHGRRGLTIQGAGKDKTILSFKDSGASEGLNVSHTDGIVIRNLMIRDTPGNGLRVFRSKYVTIDGVRVEWSDYATCSTDVEAENTCARHGAYAIYPVECDHVLIKNSEAFGASDAGVYVGQSSDIIVRNTRAEYNVAGFEFENTYRALFEDNTATNNTAGFLVFDLPGLRQYGEFNIVRNNKSFANNTDNFAPIGNIVGLAPRGTGMLMLATDLVEVYGNEIYDNDSWGIAIVAYSLADPKQGDRKYDFYPEGLSIHDNLFRDNGGNPQEPVPERDPVGTSLTSAARAKNGGRASHIAWDGGRDEPNDCTTPPVDKDGKSLYDPNVPNLDGFHPEGRRDFRGRPNYIRSDVAPNCGTDGFGQTIKYNAWKFNAEGEQPPENWLYINNNTFQNTKPETQTVTDFINFNLYNSNDSFDEGGGNPAEGAPPPVLINLLTPGSNDLTPHAIPPPARLVIPVPVLDLPFVPDPSSAEARPSPSEVARVCGRTLAAGEVNWEALAQYNCPQLHQYGLFSSASDPRSAPNGGGVPFDLNSALFSDHASKYRVLFLPRDAAGDPIPAQYRDKASNGVLATLSFPVGTVIAKTFAFRTEQINAGQTASTLQSENVVETRLLIKRQTSTGVNWVGLPYIWNKNAAGALITADLHVEGGEQSVSFDFLDPDSDVRDAAEPAKRARYTGSTDHYAIPAALNCITCHGGDDREPGAAPLGLKPRYLNRTHDYGGSIGVMNQLDYLRTQGLLTVPTGFNSATVEKHPRWNVPGDPRSMADSTGSPTAGSADDIHGRARAYIEVNCMHCHAGDGAASNSNLFLDSFRTVNTSYGICKKPVAAGKGTCEGCLYDIVPGDAANSILPFRVSSATPGVRMPPVARSIVHGEAASLITTWIDTVLTDANRTDGEEACTGPAAPSP